VKAGKNCHGFRWKIPKMMDEANMLPTPPKLDSNPLCTNPLKRISSQGAIMKMTIADRLTTSSNNLGASILKTFWNR